MTTAMSNHLAPSLLTLPTELRNTIYSYVFDPDYNPSLTTTNSDTDTDTNTYQDPPNPIAKSLRLYDNPSHQLPSYLHPCTSRRLEPLLTCRQIYSEAHLLALTLTPFHITGQSTSPDIFDLRSRPLSANKLAAIRHLTLTARISHLRALNEAWANLPFGHPSLTLETLTIVPTRGVEARCAGPYAEVAELSQSHTLAYILTETFKGLRKVNVVEVRNCRSVMRNHADGTERCFRRVVWAILYNSLVYRLWKWGGEDCGLRFECCDDKVDGNDIDERGGDWFRVHMRADETVGEKIGRDAGEEVCRLAGGVMPEMDIGGVGP